MRDVNQKMQKFRITGRAQVIHQESRGRGDAEEQKTKQGIDERTHQGASVEVFDPRSIRELQQDFATRLAILNRHGD
jgi:hypothetical protein